mmetsp:Transcript_25842/g.38706  ORF Transcript_25842/g.38706 Transcript_25842/m.38706 type:complete len:82 (+) Transcript_25842:267-512(+)
MSWHIYSTSTQWWGGYFSPLEVRPDGSITIRGGLPLSYDYNPNDGQDSIKSGQDWNPAITHPKSSKESTGLVLFEVFFTFF